MSYNNNNITYYDLHAACILKITTSLHVDIQAHLSTCTVTDPITDKTTLTSIVHTVFDIDIDLSF